MVEEKASKIPGIMRDFVGAMTSGDVEKALSFWTDDGTLAAPQGTFKGKEELRRYLTWMARSIQDMTVKDSGIGIMVQGNRAVYEHTIGGTMQGVRAETLGFCAYEFSGDKIQAVRTVFDRLSMAQQAAKGWFAKWLVGLIVKQGQKGLS